MKESEKEYIKEWHPYSNGEVRVVIPPEYRDAVDQHGLPDDLHPEFYPEWFEFREKVADEEDQASS